MSKQITELNDPRLVKALAHPIRVRIIGILERGVTSPKRMAQELGIPIENLSYHVRLLRKLGLIRLESTKQVRGTVEHFYALIGRPKITTAAWETLPQIVREALDAATISQIFDATTQAAREGKFDRPESLIARHCYRLDEQGIVELSEAMTEMIVERIGPIERRAEARLKNSHNAVPTMFIAMIFDAPSSTAPADDHPGKPARRRTKGTAITG